MRSDQLHARIQTLADDLAARASRTCPGCNTCDGTPHATLAAIAALVRQALADDE